jgi:hypothetical protein
MSAMELGRSTTQETTIEINQPITDAVRPTTTATGDFRTPTRSP